MTDETIPEPPPPSEDRVTPVLQMPKRDAGVLYRRLVKEQPAFIQGYLAALLETEQLLPVQAKQLSVILVPKEGALDSRKALQKDALDTLAFFED